MRRLEFLEVAAALAVSPGAFAANPAKGGAPASLQVALSVTPAAPHGRKGALLVEASRALRLTAGVFDPCAAAAGCRASGAAVLRWRCAAGTLSSVEGAATVWTPPLEGADTRISCDYEARYELAPAMGRPAPSPVVLRATATTRVIAAASSALLRDGRIDGFEIGQYPKIAVQAAAAAPHAAGSSATAASARQSMTRAHPDAYAVPGGFYRVTSENRKLAISESFTLGDFAHAYPWESLGLPQYIALDCRLVEKLEDLLALLRADGRAKRKFALIYGFRPPSYNSRTRADDPQGTLKAPFSMHQYGKAADIIVDDDGDLRLDDLNGDGKSDIGDARALLKYVDALDAEYLRKGDARVGGAGVYGHHDFAKRAQSPYVHVDVRGFTGGDGHPIRWAFP